MYNKGSCEFVLNNVQKTVRFAFTRTVYLLQGQYLQLVAINVLILRYGLTGGHHNGEGDIFLAQETT
jgi:hypothetical protein